MKFVVIGVLCLSVLLGFAFWKYAPSLFEKEEIPQIPPNIQVWGFEEDEPLFKLAIAEYKKVKSEATVTFVKQTKLNYRSRTQTLIGSNKGPDIFVLHNSWTGMFLQTNSMASIPDSVMSVGDYSKNFYPIAKQSFVGDKNIYGISRGIDGLVLYYNEDTLKAAGVIVPENWAQFVSAAVRTTVVDSSGIIRNAGAGVGTTNNVEFWSEILGLLFNQEPGASLAQPNTESGVRVLTFYTDFVKNGDKKVWDANLPSDTQMFANGLLTFYFAPSSKAAEIKKINPSLKFKTTRVPQLSGKDVGWGSYWGYTVSAKSRFSKDAWEFLNFYTSNKMQQLLFAKEVELKGIGTPYSRIDLKKNISDDPILGAVVNQAPVFTTWYLNSGTEDQGINDEMIDNFKQAVDGVNRGQNPTSLLQATASRVEQILSKYTAQTPAPPIQQ